MKKVYVLNYLFIISFIVTFAAPALSFWDEPNLLSELNDSQNGFAANSPVISSDEMSILFSRHYPGNDYSLWEALRNPKTNLFDQQRKLTELKNRGSLVFGSWLSEDKLRLYYAAPDPQNLGWSIRPIWMATRNSIGGTWQTKKRHAELEVEALQVNCSLTADEKLIMYESVAEAGTTDRRIFTASRESINSPFTIFLEHYELEALEASIPQMSQEGLSVYFRIKNESGFYEAWMGTRISLYEPFTNFAPIEEINALASTHTGTPFPSWDGTKLYFAQTQGDPEDLNAKGIFVAHWIDPPEVVVEKNLAAAIEAKQAILEELTATIQMEIETLQILDQLQELTEEGDAFFKTLQKRRINIQKALQNEILAQTKISESIRDLQKAAEEYVY